MSKGKWQKKFEKLQKEYQDYKDEAERAMIELSNKNQEKSLLLDGLKPRIAALETSSIEISARLRDINHKYKETLAFCAIVEMRLAATEPETNFWQQKAEDLVVEFVRTGTIDSETIRRLPNHYPYGPGIVEKANYRKPDAER